MAVMRVTMAWYLAASVSARDSSGGRTELLGTDRERDRKDGGHGDRDTADEQNENIVNTSAVRIAVRRVQHEDLDCAGQQDTRRPAATH